LRRKRDGFGFVIHLYEFTDISDWGCVGLLSFLTCGEERAEKGIRKKERIVMVVVGEWAYGVRLHILGLWWWDTTKSTPEVLGIAYSCLPRALGSGLYAASRKKGSCEK